MRRPWASGGCCAKTKNPRKSSLFLLISQCVTPINSKIKLQGVFYWKKYAEFFHFLNNYKIKLVGHWTPRHSLFAKYTYLDIMVVSSQYRDRATFMAHFEHYIILKTWCNTLLRIQWTDLLCETFATKIVKLEELCSWTWFFCVHWENLGPYCGTCLVRT